MTCALALFRLARSGDHATLAVSGEVDISNAGCLRGQLEALAAEGCRYVVVDLSGLEFCDARGLAALVGGCWAVRRRAPDGWLRVAGARPAVARMMALTGLDAVLDVYGTVAEAEAGSAAGQPAGDGHGDGGGPPGLAAAPGGG